jgi:sigma-B regulation protein RsbU (phosphoserine phosphatase)
MLLRTRISLLVGLALPVVAAAMVLPAALLLRERNERIATLQLEQQQAEVARVLVVAARPGVAVMQAAVADPAFRADAGRRDAEALQRRLAERQPAAGALQDARIEVIGRGDQLLAAFPGGRSGEPMVATDALFRDLVPGQEITGVERAPQDGTLRLVSVVRLETALVALSVPIGPALDRLAQVLRAEVLAADLQGRPLSAPDAPAWQLLADAGALRVSMPVRLTQGRSATLVVPTELRSTSGLHIARLLVLRDGSAETRRSRLVGLLAIMVLVGIVAIAGVVMYRTMRAALDPLTGLAGVLRAVAAGDTFASTSVPDRKDEVGEIAQAFESLRRSGLALDRHEMRDRLARRRDVAVMSGNLARLAEVLEPREREEAAQLLRRVESGDAAGSALATAFERMADGVLHRHERLAELLEERTRDLATVREALAQRVVFDRMVEELEVARRVQMSSLPSEFPVSPAFRLHAAMRPAKEVGGDFYDFVMLDGDRLAMMVGDASGKGVAAAIFVAMTRSLLHAAVVRGASPAEALAQANDTLTVDNATMMFATVFVGILDCRTGTLRYANAGHNAPRIVRDGTHEAPIHGHGVQGIALGVFEHFAFEDHEMTVLPGDVLLLFTDGVTEAEGPGEELFGDDRLSAALLAAASEEPGPLIERIDRVVDEFAADQPQADDITMLCLSFRALQPAKAP